MILPSERTNDDQVVFWLTHINTHTYHTIHVVNNWSTEKAEPDCMSASDCSTKYVCACVRAWEREQCGIIYCLNGDVMYRLKGKEITLKCKTCNSFIIYYVRISSPPPTQHHVICAESQPQFRISLSQRMILPNKWLICLLSTVNSWHFMLKEWNLTNSTTDR